MRCTGDSTWCALRASYDCNLMPGFLQALSLFAFQLFKRSKTCCYVCCSCSVWRHKTSVVSVKETLINHDVCVCHGTIWADGAVAAVSPAQLWEGELTSPRSAFTAASQNWIRRSNAHLSEDACWETKPGSVNLIYLTNVCWALINNAPILLSASGGNESIWKKRRNECAKTKRLKKNWLELKLLLCLVHLLIYRLLRPKALNYPTGTRASPAIHMNSSDNISLAFERAINWAC